jgi:hypothetical protein
MHTATGVLKQHFLSIKCCYALHCTCRCRVTLLEYRMEQVPGTSMRSLLRPSDVAPCSLPTRPVMRDNAYTDPPAAAVTSKQKVAITDAAPMTESTKNNELSYCRRRLQVRAQMAGITGIATNRSRQQLVMRDTAARTPTRPYTLCGAPSVIA